MAISLGIYPIFRQTHNFFHFFSINIICGGFGFNHYGVLFKFPIACGEDSEQKKHLSIFNQPVFSRRSNPTLDILGIFMSILIFHELGIAIHQVSLGNFFNRFMTERVFGRL